MYDIQPPTLLISKTYVPECSGMVYISLDFLFTGYSHIDLLFPLTWAVKHPIGFTFIFLLPIKVLFFWSHIQCYPLKMQLLPIDKLRYHLVAICPSPTYDSMTFSACPKPIFQAHWKSSIESSLYPLITTGYSLLSHSLDTE